MSIKMVRPQRLHSESDV
jgi:hypothetical protein